VEARKIVDNKIENPRKKSRSRRKRDAEEHEANQEAKAPSGLVVTLGRGI
jgi:hypothetical protein